MFSIGWSQHTHVAPPISWNSLIQEAFLSWLDSSSCWTHTELVWSLCTGLGCDSVVWPFCQYWGGMTAATPFHSISCSLYTILICLFIFLDVFCIGKTFVCVPICVCLHVCAMRYGAYMHLCVPVYVFLLIFSYNLLIIIISKSFVNWTSCNGELIYSAC